MKLLGVAVMAVLVVGSFASIPNVSAALAEANVGKPYVSQGTRHLSTGSESGKVCGAELCSSKSIPKLTVQEKKSIVVINSGNQALERALEGAVASNIMAAYYQYQDFDADVPEETPEELVEDTPYKFDNFANEEFRHPVNIPTTVQTQTMTIDGIRDGVTIKVPDYIKEYANPNHPVYVKQPRIFEGEVEIEIEIEKEVVINANQTDEMANFILFNLGFDVDESKVGICGPGTELVNGFCMIAGEVPEDVTTDWADFWDTKEEKEIVLEQIIMTNGTEAIPVVDDMVVEVVEEVVEGEPTAHELLADRDINNPFEIPDEQNIVLGSIEEPVEDTTVVVDGKVFKSQASADRFMAMQGNTVEEVVEEVVEPVVEELPEPEPVVEPITNNNSTSGTTGPTGTTGSDSSDDEVPPPFEIQ